MKSVDKFASLIFVFILLCFSKSYSQSEYRTTNGYVLVAGSYNDSAFFAESHKLVIKFDAANKIIFGIVNLETFSSGISFIDSTLSKKSNSVTLNGYVPVDFLTWDHVEYNLDIPLEVEINNRKITTLAKLKFSHVDKLTNYTCILEASFKLRLSDFKISVPSIVESDINVQFLQVILRRGSK